MNSDGFRAGFVLFLGRPNAGKSTLMNALVGSKVAITSGKPQTTRHTIRGVVHRPGFQLIIMDTPGFHRPRTLLGWRLNDLVLHAVSEVDLLGVCLPAPDALGPGDRFILERLAQGAKKPVVALVTKIDAVDRDALTVKLAEVERFGRAHLGGEGFEEIVPVSALTGTQVSVVENVCARYLPLCPPLYPEGDLTDEPEAVMVAELVREAALEGVREELPHSIAVIVEEMVPREGRPTLAPLLDVRVHLFVERSSQKGILIGKNGARLKEVGTRARAQIEALLGTRVYLDIRVKVAKEWQRDPKMLARLGF